MPVTRKNLNEELLKKRIEFLKQQREILKQRREAAKRDQESYKPSKEIFHNLWLGTQGFITAPGYMGAWVPLDYDGPDDKPLVTRTVQIQGKEERQKLRKYPEIPVKTKLLIRTTSPWPTVP